MSVVQVIITALFVIDAVFLAVTILLQEGKSAGLSGSISGASETYWSKNRGRSKEGKMEKLTKISAALFMIFAVVLNIVYKY